MPKRDDLEYKALHMVINTGKKGMLQSELWRKLYATSREGSRIAIKLENKGLISRKRELSIGRWTYRLYSKRQQPSINSIIEVPCLTCPDDPRCVAWGIVSPNNCEKLTEWILSFAKDETKNLGDS